MASFGGAGQATSVAPSPHERQVSHGLDMAAAPSLPLPSTEEGGQLPRKLKHKRKQNTACDACRLRRVRCLREPDAVDCTPCLAKGIACTTEYVSQKPKIHRSGRLIREAQASFGAREPDRSPTRSPLSSTPTYPPHASTSAVPLPSPDLQTANALLSINPFEQQALVLPTVNSTLIISLVKWFYDYVHFQVPIVDWEGFYGRFEAAGCRPAEMGAFGEVLCMAVCAFGARVADNPEILGPGAPSLTQLRERAVDSVDLSVWGDRRKPFCRALLQRTLALVDSRGVFRRPTMDGICSLLLLQYLIDHGGDPEDGDQGRMLSAAALEQMRALNDSPNGMSPAVMGQIRGGRLFWCSFIRDAMQAAHSGRALQITTLDIHLFCPLLLQPDRSASVYAELSSNDPASVARSAAFNLFGELALLARSISDKITGPAATGIPSRQTPLDLEWIANVFWRGVDSSTDLCEFFRSRIGKLFAARASTFELWLRTLCFCRLALVALMHSVLSEESVRVGNSGDPHAVRLQQMLVESQRRLFAALREMVDIVRASALTGVAFGGGLLLSGLPHFTTLMVSLPSAEEGGPAEWTLPHKIDSIRWMHLAMKRMSWAWGDETGAIRSVEAALAPLQARLAEMEAAAQYIHAPIPPPIPEFDESAYMGMGGGVPMPLLPPAYRHHGPPSHVNGYQPPREGWMTDLDALLDPNLLR